MDDNSFIGTSNGISRILRESKSVFMNVEDLIMDTEAYQECKIEPIPWKQTLGYVSMAVSKDSPLKKFMDLVILDIMESGSLEQSRLKWSIKKADCQTGVRPISPQKVIMTFIGISAGMVFALVTFVVEKVTWKIYRRRKIQPKYNYIKEELRICMEKIRYHREKMSKEKFEAIIKEIRKTPRIIQEDKSQTTTHH